ncbi:MAG: DNA-binding NarL/FixJ family response regulator [Saprospiraceae bacterium]|jgi:DNA-binding NarL/FixJ family response regulator
MKKFKIVIVDDHLLFSNSLKKLIESFGDYEISKQLVNGKDFIDYIRSEEAKPDLVLLDVQMPVMDGRETMAWISDHLPDQKVLILSMNDDKSSIIQLLKLGARGYILKDINPLKFKEAIGKVIHSGFYHSEWISTIMFEEMSRDSNSDELLSDKKIEFLNKVCSDKTYKEIAGEMFLSPKTIDGYRANLFKKLNVKSRVGLAMYAIKSGLIKI